MILLEAVNAILTKLGENPVDHVDVKHPTVSIVLQHLQSTNKELQVSGWWFNQHTLTLEPDFQGHIFAPEGTIKWLTKKEHTHLKGKLVVCSNTLKETWDRPLTASIIRNVSFEDLPETFADWVVAEAAVRAYIADYGLEDVVQLWKGEAAAKLQLVWVEHLQNKRHSTIKTGRAMRIYQSMWR